MRGAGNCWSGSPPPWYNTLWLGPLSSVAAIASAHLMRGLLQLSKKGTRVCSLEQMVLTCMIVGVLMKCQYLWCFVAYRNNPRKTNGIAPLCPCEHGGLYTRPVVRRYWPCAFALYMHDVEVCLARPLEQFVYLLV